MQHTLHLFSKEWLKKSSLSTMTELANDKMSE